MKTKSPHFFSSAAAFFVLILALTVNIISQPMHYNYNTTGATNSFPWNIVAGKQIQVLFLPGDFNQPTPAPSGNITSVSFRLAAQLGPYTYTNVVIKMGQATGLTTFATGVWYAGQLDTVYSRASVQLGGAANTWMTINLDTPFPYDNTKSLIIDVQQCAVPGATGFSTGTTTLPGNRRNTSLVNTSCPFPWGQQSGTTPHMGINIAPASNPPDYLYYKFENNPTSSSVINCALPGVGTSPATMTGLTLTPGGQFDSCLTGSGVTGAGIVTGWNNSLGTSSWTISMWIDCNTTTFGYLFGDGGGSFRCFNNGAAGTGGITLRGTGITNVDVPNVNTGPVVIHFVYDSAAANIKVYRNGVLSSTVSQTPLNLTAGTGFKVGGYTTVAGFTGKMDEFRLYRRALDSTEIAATWNQDIPCGTLVSVPNTNNQLPQKYSLEQNYPNPFNPTTNITFALPKAGNITLKVYDILGREVMTIVNSYVNAGTHIVPFDASSLSSGVYIYKINAGEFTDSKKMVLIK